METSGGPKSNTLKIILWIAGAALASILACAGLFWLIMLWYASMIEDAMQIR